MTCMASAPVPRRGEIWLIDFDPAVGAGFQKRRPAVVISMDTIGRLPLRMVVPTTNWKPQYANYLRFARVRGGFRERRRWVVWMNESQPTPLVACGSRGRPARPVGHLPTPGPAGHPGPSLPSPAPLERPADSR